MQVNGRILKVTALEGFLRSYLDDPAHPDPDTFAPLANARVRLSGVPLSRPLGGDESAADGSFSFAVAQLPLVGNARLRVDSALLIPPLAGRPATVGGHLPAFRSATVPLASLDDEPLDVFVATSGLSGRIDQARVDAEVAGFAAELGTDELTAAIEDGGLRVHARLGPARVAFVLRLRPDTSADLDAFVAGAIEELDIRVPFPVSLCHTKKELTELLEQGVAELLETVNAEIKQQFIDAAAQAAGVDPALVGLLADEFFTLTVARLSYPGGAIEIHPALGVPRGLLTPAQVLPAKA
jgi:hypothetical protein